MNLPRPVPRRAPRPPDQRVRFAVRDDPGPARYGWLRWWSHERRQDGTKILAVHNTVPALHADGLPSWAAVTPYDCDWCNYVRPAAEMTGGWTVLDGVPAYLLEVWKIRGDDGLIVRVDTLDRLGVARTFAPDDEVEQPWNGQPVIARPPERTPPADPFAGFPTS